MSSDRPPAAGRAVPAGMPAAETLRRITRPQAPPLVPELRFAGLPPGLGLEAFRTRHAAVLGAAVPYWAVAWPGGQALARLLLDRPGTVAGRGVIDIGCGNGLVAAAAMRAGAAAAVAMDPDPLALLAAAECARLNGVRVTPRQGDLGALAAAPPPPGTVICAGDLWYEPRLAREATAVLGRLAAGGCRVLFGDPGRPGRPRRGVVELARHEAPGTAEFDAGPRLSVRVCSLEARNILPAHGPPAGGGGDAAADLG